MSVRGVRLGRHGDVDVRKSALVSGQVSVASSSKKDSKLQNGESHEESVTNKQSEKLLVVKKETNKKSFKI